VRFFTPTFASKKNQKKISFEKIKKNSTRPLRIFSRAHAIKRKKKDTKKNKGETRAAHTRRRTFPQRTISLSNRKVKDFSREASILKRVASGIRYTCRQTEKKKE